MDYEIKGVSDTKQLNDFIALPYIIYNDDPHWVPPIKSELKRTLSLEKNPYFSDTTLQLFNCYKTGEICSQVAIIINKQHQQKYGEKTAFFGFFESINDPTAVVYLFEKIEQYCIFNGIESIEGPFNPNHYSELGLKADQFDMDLEHLRDVFNDAFSQNWHFLPVSQSEYLFCAKYLNLVTYPELIQFVEHKGKPVAAIQFVLDINPYLQKFVGKLNVLRYLHFLSEKKKIKKIIVYAVGGGFASFTTRAFTTSELLLQQSTGYFPGKINSSKNVSLKDFGQEITNTLLEYFTLEDLPELILEPGRSIASPNQFLVLKVHRVKIREGVGRWLVTDGGIGTNSLPTYYEYHEVFLVNEVVRPIIGKATIIGPCCFAADIVYKNNPMPNVKPGEVLAIMDTGAYFTSLESSFGFPRPAIVAVTPENHYRIRHRETFDEMVGRDHYKKEGEKNEVFCH